jgi:very-short-patch-repair endonuclease
MSTQRTPPPPLAGEGREGALPQGVSVDDTPRSPDWHISKDTRDRARALRRDSTDAERRIWSALRGNRMKGAGCRRQAPLGPYIVDFVCHAAKLVIELDGGQHFEGKQIERDRRRDAYLKREGYRVLRFNNHDVMANRQGVLETIATLLGDAPSLPSPASGGGGVRGSGGVSS